MKRAAILVLLAGCGQEPPPPAPPAFFASALPEPRGPEPALPAGLPMPEREVPDLDHPPLPAPRLFGPEPSWDRHHGYRAARSEWIGTVPPSRGRAENRPAVLETLARIARRQEADGSWIPAESCADCGPGADRTETTALALLAFVRAGIPTRERYLHDGIPLEAALRQGLRWICTDQDSPASSPRRSLRQRALAAAVLAGAADGTGSLLLDVHAAEAAALLRETPVAGADANSIAWAAEALFRGYPLGPAHPTWVPAARSELDSLFPRADETALARWATARILLDLHKGDRSLYEGMQELLRRKPSPDRADLAYWHAGTRAVSGYDGPSGPLWKAWSASLLPLLESRRGSLACPRAAALAALTLLHLHPPAWRSRSGHRSGRSLASQ